MSHKLLLFSTLGKRQALRDVGKAFGMTEAELSNLTRMLVRRFGTLADEYENNQRFKAEVLKNGKLKRIYEVARRIEGMPVRLQHTLQVSFFLKNVW